MFLFDRSFGAAVAGLAVALLFVCFDRACEVAAADADGARPASVAPLAAVRVVAEPLVTAVSTRVAAVQLAISTTPACPAPAAWGTLRAGS
jgi:hypothetical protein